MVNLKKKINAGNMNAFCPGEKGGANLPKIN